MLPGVPTLSVGEYLVLLNEVLAAQRAVIIGEVSSYKVSQEKWVSFKLKDLEGEGVLDCFTVVYQLPVPIKDGDKITVVGYPRIYTKSGRFSFYVQNLTLSGEGALKKAFEALQAKLAAEGLFDPVHKKAIPRFPHSIGLITSKEGAVLHDMLAIINGRFGGLTIVLFPVAVQGAQAVPSIVAAIEYANRFRPVDSLILARGGGSLEDLQAFNSEPVTRAIFSSRIPIVAGIGHEPDVTLADLAADRRAPTPTAAAKLIVPDRAELIDELASVGQTLSFVIDRELQSRAQAVVGLAHRTERAIGRILELIRVLVGRFAADLSNASAQLRERRIVTATLSHRLIELQRHRLGDRSLTIEGLERTLLGLHPLTVLDRGYSITLNEAHQVVYDAATVKSGETITSRVAKGSIRSTVKE